MKTVIEMAREAGFVGFGEEGAKKLERFAALVREDERESCAKVCDEMGKTQFIPNHDVYIIPYKPQDCAAAIRARGEK